MADRSENEAEYFNVAGRAVTTAGDPLPGIRLAVVDRDPLRDDLLGVGFTDQEGRFRISFVSSEFNQDPLENERFPDLYLVFSVYDEGRFRTLARCDSLQPVHAEGRVDLGDVIVASSDNSPEDVGCHPTPGFEKRVQRLSLDNRLVEHCLCEVAPLVEQLTGWGGLLRTAGVRVTSEPERFLSGQLSEWGLDEDSWTERAIASLLYAGAYGVYDPFSGMIVVNEQMCSRGNLDGLKVVLGHELVHHGQFSNTQGLKERYARACRDLIDCCRRDSTESLEQLLATVRSSPAHRLLHELEGYAYYLQTDHLQRHYNCAMMVPHVSLLSRVVHAVSDLLDLKLSQAGDLKKQQYEEGRHRYRQAARSGRPPRFNLSE